MFGIINENLIQYNSKEICLSYFEQSIGRKICCKIDLIINHYASLIIFKVVCG